MIDTTAPVAGILQLTDFTDTGISATDQISQDKSFTLQLAQPIMIGEQVAFLDHFEVSTDNGQTWNITDAEQTDLVDGTYQFKGVVTDAAGNHAETIIQQVTVDRKLELLNDIVQIESVTEDNTISLSEKDQVIPIRIQIDHLPNDVNQTLTSVTTTVGGTIFNFTFDPIHQDWVVEIPATSLWSDQQHNSLTIDISFTDIAGNTATFQQIHDFQLNHIPPAPQILEAKSNNLDGSIISGTAYKGSIVDFYTKNGEWIASAVANERGEFTLKTSLINADQEIYVTAKVDEYTSEVSLPITVVEVPFLNIIKISPEGIITGYATEGSYFSVRDGEGNLIQVFPSVAFDGSVITPLSPMNLGNVHPFTLVLDKPLTEGSEIIITAEKNGFIGHPQLIIADYTPAEFLEQPMFNEEGDHLLVHTNEPNTLILVFSKISENMIGFGYSDENGVAHVEISQTLNEGEQVRVQLLDKNQNMSEVIINAPNFAYAPNVYHISQDGLISGWVETNSTIIVKDANGIVLGEELSGEGFIWNHDFTEFNLLVNRSLTDGEQLFIHIVDVKGLVSPETVINVDFTPPLAPTHLYFNEKGDWIYGTAEAFTEITITDKNGTVLNHWGWDRWTDQNGNFSIELNHYLTNADIVYVTAKDSNGNISLVTEVTAPNYAFAPIIENLTNQGLFTGYAESNSTLIIKDAHNVTIAEITISNNNSGNDLSYFSFNLNKSLINGETFTLSIIDHNGLISAETIVIADVVAPEPAKDVMFVEDGYSLIGTAELGSKIRVFDQNGTQVNWSTDVQSDGSFHISLGNHYLHGEAFTVTVTDRAGNISQAISVNAPIDDIAPSPIEQIVLNTDGQRFTAQAESNSRIEVLDQSGRSVGWGSTDSQGNVSGYFNQIYLHGEELRFITIDRAGNRSAEIQQTALIDNIAPNVIGNIIFNENGQSFTGLAEAESRIEVFDATGAQVGWGNTDSSGSVSGYLNQTYLKGQELSFVVIDRAGNCSVEVKQTALNDDVAPNAITNIILNENGQNFTAVAEAQGQVEVLNAAGYQVGWGYVDSSGNVSGTFYQTYFKGQELTFVVIDRAGNRSVEVKQTALNDDVAPNAITNIILNENGQNFTAVAEAQSQVEVFDATGTKVGWGNTDSSGNVSGYLNQTYLKGQELTFVVIDRAGNRSVDVKQTALSDDIAPSPIKQIVLNEDGQRFTAQAEADSQIEVLDQLGSRVGWGYVDGVGNVSGYFNQIYLHGEQLKFVVVDRAGNRSIEVKQIALIDNIAPNAIQNIVLNENGSNFTAQTEVGSSIEVLDQSGNRVGWGFVDSLGNVSGSFNQVYLHGEELRFIAIDRAGNRSSEVRKIAFTDNIAPNPIENIIFNENGQNYTAKTEANATIEVKDKDGNLVGRSYSDNNGHVNGYLMQVFLKGETLTFIVIDSANNQSIPVTTHAFIDNTAPLAAQNVSIGPDGWISGYAEAYSIVEIMDQYGAVIATTQVDYAQKFNLLINLSQYQTQDLTLIIKDIAGNSSEAVHQVLPLITNSPAQVADLTIDVDGHQLTGIAKVGSYIIVTDITGKRADLGWGMNKVVNSDGTFTIELDSYYLKGQTLQVRVFEQATDQYSQIVEIITPLDNTLPEEASQLAINELGYLIGHAESTATVEIIYHLMSQETHTNTVVVSTDGMFTFGIYENATSFDLTVIDRAGNRSETISQLITNLPKITVDQLKGDATNNTYTVDHVSDFVQEYEVVVHEVYQDVWINTSHYEEQWVVTGYNGFIWIDTSHFEDVWIDTSYPQQVWIDTSFYQDVWVADGTRDVYTDSNGINYYSNDGSYEAYMSTYYDSKLSQWQLGYELFGPYAEDFGHNEQQLINGGYFEYQMVPQGHYEQQYISEGYNKPLWVDTSHYENVWVESGYWENQLITSEYRDVDFGGHDKIISSVDYSLLGQYQWITDVTLQQLHLESGRYVEDLELVGFANLNATGNALDNHLTGNSGNNILDGRDGNDTYSSGDGSDKIIFHLLNVTDVTGGNGQDTVLDFYLGDVKTDAQADQIDLSDLLVGYSGNASSVSNFINVKQENGSTIISIDRDGKETTFESAQLITLNQTNTTLADLLNNQQIVLFH
nr:Ig-like domain-containing protein [Acinetobacter modestus]